MRDGKIPLRDYVDRGLADLATYHRRDIDGLQAEIDRRMSEMQRETGFRLGSADSQLAALLTRVERAEAALERQRGRAAAYVAVSTFLMLAVTILTLILNHTRL